MRRNEQGQVLLAALMVLALLVVLGTAGLTLAASNKQASTGELDRTQALYAAEAGVNKALLLLKADPLWEDSGGQLAGDYKDASGKTVAHTDYVRVTTEASSWDSTVKTIVAQASAGQARRTLTVKAEIDAAPFTSYAGLGVNIVPVPGTSSPASLTLENGTEIHMDLLYKGGTLTFAAGRGYRSGWNSIVGSSEPDDHWIVRATGRVEFDMDGFPFGGSPDSVVYGYVYANTIRPPRPSRVLISDDYQANWIPNPPIPAYPDIDADTYRRAAKLMDAVGFPGGPHYFEGNTDITLNENMEGVYFVEGEATIAGGSYNKRVTIAARNGIKITHFITRSTAGSTTLTLITPCDITIDKTVAAVRALLFTDGNLVIDSSSGTHLLLRGIYTRGLMEKGKGSCGSGKVVKFIKDNDREDEMPPGFPVTVKILSWEE